MTTLLTLTLTPGEVYHTQGCTQRGIPHPGMYTGREVYLEVHTGREVYPEVHTGWHIPVTHTGWHIPRYTHREVYPRCYIPREVYPRCYILREAYPPLYTQGGIPTIHTGRYTQGVIDSQGGIPRVL